MTRQRREPPLCECCGDLLTSRNCLVQMCKKCGEEPYSDLRALDIEDHIPPELSAKWDATMKRHLG